MNAEAELVHLRRWIGKTEEGTDIVTPHLVRALRATLFLNIGNAADGDPAPLTVQWCLAQPVVAAAELGPDGHPARGGFLPPVSLPRRMWAGGQITFHDPICVGDEVTRSSRIADVALKQGASGQLCFVTVHHEITTPRGIAVTERQDIVYRDSAPRGAPPASSSEVVPPGKHRRSHMADAVLLFRYSALTFNAHRIHYDRSYVTDVEGYPGLVFHGPLQAALLANYAAALHGGECPKRFDYRAVAPLFDGSEFSLNADDTPDGLALWTADSGGRVTMKATATY
jgi:3-methylfumaryl-CoA hydratase